MKHKAVNPYFNDFVYSVIYDAPEDTKKTLSLRHQKLFRKMTTLRKWIEVSGVDEIDMVLAQLGIQFFRVYVDLKRYGQPRYLRQVFDKFNDTNRLAELQNIIKTQTYISTDKDLVHALGMMASITHSGTYLQNLELNRGGYHIAKLQKRLDSTQSQQALQDAATADYLVKTSLNATIAYRATTAIFGLTEMDMELLKYLYIPRNTYTSFDKIRGNFPEFKTTKITVCLKRLVEMQLVVRHASEHKNFQISSLGIGKVNELLKHILKNNSL